MKAIALLAFLAGLLLWVRVMFFGVQRRLDHERVAHRRWPLALSALLVASGAALYAAASRGPVTWLVLGVVVLAGLLAGAAAWWLVQRSAAMPSTDPEDDPRYRFQGHVARIVAPIGDSHGGDASRDGSGAIAFEFDGARHELRARWTTAGAWEGEVGGIDREVVIERVEGDVAYVEPWTVVEERL